MRSDKALPSLPGMWLTKDQGNTKGRLRDTEKEQHPVATPGLQFFRMLLTSLIALLLEHIIFLHQRTAEPRPGSTSDDTRDPFTITYSFPLNPEIISIGFQI